MATSKEIKGFIAQWLQLGKHVEHVDGNQQFKPLSILDLDGYSEEFECWWENFERTPHKWALSGMHQPLSELYAPELEISTCARCDMPVPLQGMNIRDGGCPCQDLPLWPNTELPQPRKTKDFESTLKKIHSRLCS